MLLSVGLQRYARAKIKIPLPFSLGGRSHKKIVVCNGFTLTGNGPVPNHKAPWWIFKATGSGSATFAGNMLNGMISLRFGDNLPSEKAMICSIVKAF